MQRITDKLSTQQVYSRLLIVLILLFTSGCSWDEVRLELCWKFSNGTGQILHSHPNPSGYAIIHVVNVDCGQSSYSPGGPFYKCSTRLDLEWVSDRRIIQGYEATGVCDAKVRWLDDYNFEVIWANGKKTEMNFSEGFGILP
jgi:hypothetical protein